jgi:Cu/Ag efflux protein CusF
MRTPFAAIVVERISLLSVESGASHWEKPVPVELNAGSVHPMNKFIAPFAALAFVFSIAGAQADEAAGKVALVDPNTGSITLEDGTIFTIGEGVSMEGLEPGTEVTVSYEEKDGQLVATGVAPAN